MSYHFSKTVSMAFPAAVEKVTAELTARGFGILTRIDVQQTLEAKLGVGFRPYLILGACNPPFAYRALQTEDKVGTMLPCNVIVQQRDGGTIEISAVDPVASMAAIDNAELAAVAGEVREMLRAVVDAV
ncbi:MAG: DUF302 domain-containing protein [Steroidobacteraceae bacterium]|jgi:uncharacterized protein (DUF302 family)|nr:DUF302 domain-containing protein [Burkholderiaceae bacterium]MBX3704176.1 DUF302 domain-containing protein [Steroidobacteraceae bacterium]